MALKYNIVNYSSQFTLGVEETMDDVRKGLSLDPLFFGMTEGGEPEIQRKFLGVVSRMGYQPFIPPDGATIMAVREDVEVLRKFSVLGNPAQPGKPSQGGHGPRYLVGITGLWQGEVITDIAGHWITGYGRRDVRRRQHDQMTEIAMREVAAAGAGVKIAHLHGDLNYPDSMSNKNGPERQFQDYRVLTCWEERDYFPDTHPGGPSSAIDFIARRADDGRVSCLEAGTLPVNSDHDTIWAQYAIRPRPRRGRG